MCCLQDYEVELWQCMFVVTEELSSFSPQSFFRGPSTTVKIVLDKPYTVPLTLSSFGFLFSKRKVSEFGAQLSSSTGLSTSAGYPPRSPENGPLLLAEASIPPGQ